MEKNWLASYQQGVPHEIDLNAYESVVDLFEQSCEKFHSSPAFENFGSKLSFAELDQKSKYFAAYLQNVLELKPGDRIILMLPNLLQFPVALFGAMRAGLIVVCANPLYTPAELIHVAHETKPQAIVVFVHTAFVVEQALKQASFPNVIVTEIGDLLSEPKGFLMNFAVKHVKKMVPKYDLPQSIAFKEVLKQGKKQNFSPVHLTHDDIAFLQFTGGTTGVFKGAVLTHRNILANMLQMLAWVKPTLNEYPNQTIITALPLYHILSLTVNCLGFMAIGGLNFLITDPRNIPDFISRIKKVKFTAFTGVNTLFQALLRKPEFQEVDFTRLRITIGGGMAVQERVAEEWQKVTGCPLIEGYGLTEASPVVSANPLDIDKFNGSIGLPLPSTDVSVRSDNDEALPYGEIGELCVKGPQVMPGYWQNPEETANVFTDDGWLKTGDMVKLNENGYLYLIDRKKDVIIVSGFNVFPNEVEAVIAKNPKVSEVAVIGVPDEHSGEAVKAFIVKKDNDLTKDMLEQYCQKELTMYKVPKEFEFRESLPKTPVGKILRRALRE
ncbi:MAG: AMP-binding protein [Gammaproteobacteria bacterium]